MSGRSLIFVAILVVVFATIQGCGTEGTTNTTEFVMTVPGYKQLSFLWSDVFGSTHCDIMCSQDGQSEATNFFDARNLSGPGATLDVPVHLINWGQAEFSVVAHNEANTFRAPIGPARAERNMCEGAIGFLKGPNPGANDSLGHLTDISADGKTLLVSSVYEDSNARGVDGDQLNDLAVDSGAAFIYVKVGNRWQLQAYLKASNTDASDFFGLSGALSADGNTCVISALWEDSPAREINGDQSLNTAIDAGAAYVFQRTGENWRQCNYLKSLATDSQDMFGGGIAITGDGKSLAVASLYENSGSSGFGGDPTDNSVASSGGVFLY